MKSLFLSIVLAITSISANCQYNGGFENNSVDGCRNETGKSFNALPFNLGRVPYWLASQGSPQIQRVGCPSTEADVHTGSEAAFLQFSNSNKEGIYKDFDQIIHKDESFNIAIFAKGTNSKIIIKFTNGLENVSGANSPNIPNPSSQQLVIEQSLTNTWQEVRVDELIANDDYSQIWIYAMDGDILIDDFSFYKSCCEPYKLWQNITNPPSTYVNNYIKAGENVDADGNTEFHGTLRATKVNVDARWWSDFVFADDYKLSGLAEVEAFIIANRHLPNVPSEKEVLENGLDLANMQAIQQQKIEELTLYIIQLKKEVDAMKTEIEQLKK